MRGRTRRRRTNGGTAAGGVPAALPLGGDRQAEGAPPSADGVAPATDVTLETMCACGHARRDHSGLRLEVRGRCLRCEDCGEFAPAGMREDSAASLLERLRRGLEQVGRLQDAVEELRAGVSQPLLARAQWLALEREVCGARAAPAAEVPMHLDGQMEHDRAEGAPARATQLRVCPCERAEIVWLGERLVVYLAREEALVFVCEPARGDERRLIWRGRLEHD